MQTRKNTGFTLIELILYVALVALFLSGAITFAWNIIYANAKSNVEREVSENLRFATRRIEYEIRNASQILSVATTALCLESGVSARNPTRIYLSSGQLRIGWGGGSTDCTGLTNDQPLTSGQVTVSALAFTDRSSGAESANVLYSLTIDSTGTRQEWEDSQSASGAAEVRTD